MSKIDEPVSAFKQSDKDGLNAEIEAIDPAAFSKQVSHSDIDLQIMAPDSEVEDDNLVDQQEDAKSSLLRSRTLWCGTGLLCIGCISVVTFNEIKGRAVG